MASYSMGEIARMQSDAAERVREMARRSKELTEEERSAFSQGQTQSRPQPQYAPGPQPSVPRQEPPAPSPPQPRPGPNFSQNSQSGQNFQGQSRPQHPPAAQPDTNRPQQKPPAPSYIPPQSAPPPPNGQGAGVPGIGGLLNFLPFDLSGDRMLILLVLFMLYGDGSDRLLMLALIYLAL